MKKSMAIVIILVVAGLAVIITGILLEDFLICIIGGVPITLSPLALEIKKRRDRKSLLDYMEKDESPILSTRKKTEDIEEEERWKKMKQFFEKIIIMLIVAAAALGLVIIMIQDYFLKPTYISIETAISEGCSILHRSGCKTDPSEITVQYDVNGDEVIGGTGDNLATLLETYNCTGSCIRTRCACTA